MKLKKKIKEYWNQFCNRDKVFLVYQNVVEERGALVDYLVYLFKTWDGAVKFISKETKKSIEDVETELKDSMDVYMHPQVKYKRSYYKIVEEKVM